MIRQSTILKYVGKKYGKWTVLSYQGRDPKNIHHYFFKCKCDCGTEGIKRISNLQQGSTKSCGCYAKEVAKRVHAGNTYRRLPNGEAARNNLYRRYKRDASERGLSFSIKPEIFYKMTKQPCFYCGCAPASVRRNKNGNGAYIYNGVDRLDNSVGYNSTNCVPCCGDCNAKKNGITKEMVFKLYHALFK